jgi:peptidoglycan/xylan/chitin deacetylase (PgdA/CDA1 family)
MTDRPLPILAYHSVATTSKAWAYALELALLDEHFAYLRERNFFSLTLAESLESKELALSARPIVLTFNGAFSDFEQVVPLLGKYNFTATLFVPTAYVGKQSTYLAPEQQRPVMDWTALRGLADLEIASLGHAHFNLDEASEAEAREDISRSKELLEDNLGLRCQTFAYPNGRYTPSTIELVKNEGFIAACTFQAAISNLSHDLYALPRFAMTSQTRLSDIIGSKTKDKGRFSLLNFFRPSKRHLTPPEARYSPPPLPSKVTTEQVRQERSQQASLLRTGLVNAEPPGQVEMRTPELDAELRLRPVYREPQQDYSLERGPSSRPLPPRSPEEEAREKEIGRVADLDQQGDFLADLKTLLAQHQNKPSIEYNMFLAAVEKLQASHEAGVFAPERVRAVYQTRAQLENALANELSKQTQQQRLQLQGYLEKLSTLSVPETLQGSLENAKHIVAEYLEHLSVAALGEDVLKSTEQLMGNLEQRLKAHYRASLQTLVQEATALKALDFLIVLQRASNGLEAGHYPDLNALGHALETLKGAEASRDAVLRRSQKFSKDVAEAARTFETLSALNNEDVTTVRQLLYYLLSQREVFSKVSSTMQQELEASLREVQAILERLAKDLEATKAIAKQLVSESALDQLFGDDSSKSS